MKNKTIFILSLAVFFIAYSAKAGFPQSELNLSGKYKGYNVILIILDALRPDHLSCYGYSKQTSPNIDALAKEGVIFRNAFSQASYTLPSVTSIFTSVYPYSHGVVHVFKDKVPDKIDTLAQVLSKYGYNTAWFGFIDDPHSGAAPALLKGFKHKFDLTQIEKYTNDYGLVFKWIKENQQSSFFITIHSYSAHEQIFPFKRFENQISLKMPERFLNFFNEIELKSWNKLQEVFKDRPEEITSILGKEWIEKNKEYFLVPFSQKRIKDFDSLFKTPEDHAKRVKLDLITQHEFWNLIFSLNKQQLLLFLSLLDSAIYELDKNMMGMLVRELQKLELYDKTIIIITADHGNEFYDHGNFFHGPWLYDEVIRVPLILHLPNFKKFLDLNRFAQSIDILPTTLDLLSIKIPHQAQGISLVGLIEGRKNALNNEYVYCQGVPEGTIAIRSDNWKLFLKPGESGSIEKRLFNHKKDPRELDNVIKDNPIIAERLKSCLEAWQKSLVVYQAEEREFMPGINEETKDRIRKTGYW